MTATFTKLAIGEKAAFKVKGVTVDKAGKWPDYAFEAEDGTTYTAPQAAIDRQLKRLNLSPIELVGAWIALERAPNKEDATKSWWNLSLSNAVEAKLAPTKRITGPDAVPGEAPARYRDVPPPTDDDYEGRGLGGALDGPEGDGETLPIADQKWAGIVTAYGKAWEASKRVQGATGTSDSVQAGAATLLIAAQKAGIC